MSKPFQEDFVGINTKGRKEYSGERPNKDALEEKREQYLNEAIEKVLSNKKYKEEKRLLLANAWKTKESDDDVDAKEEFEKSLGLFQTLVWQQLREDHDLGRIGNDEKKDTEFEDTYSYEMIIGTLRRKLLNKDIRF